MHPVTELTLGEEPDAVPRARHLARAAVSRTHPALAADTELVVSELVTNASLHGRPPITVRILVDGRVRVEVEDAGRSAPLVLADNPEAMTGRGLSMVASVSRVWGVDARGGGKVVWAELDATPDDNRSTTAPASIDAVLGAGPDDKVPTYTIRLGPVATDLLLAAKSHVDNVVRELTLMREGQASSGVALPPELTTLIDTVTVDFAEARSEVRRQAAAAAARGDLVTELELHLQASSADAGERYLAALEESDRYARGAHLLTMAPPAVHRIFRRWYVKSVVEQLRALARAERPPAARPFQVVLTEEVGRLADEAASSKRCAILQEVTGALAGATSATEMARIVVERAVQLLGVESAKVRMLTAGGMLRTVARAGAGSDRPDPLPEYSVDEDLPGANAARTRTPALMRSLHRALAHRPELAANYPEGRSGHAIPLAVGDRTLGLLSVTFVSGELSDEVELSVVDALGDALAQGLERVELADREAETRESLRLLADATQLLISARQPSEVLEHLANLAVPRLGDWCTVFLVDGAALRRAAIAVHGHPDLAALLRGRTLPVDSDTPPARVFRTGRPEWLDTGAGHLLSLAYPDLDLATVGLDLEGTSGLAVPIELRGKRLGVISLTFHDGRPVTPAMIETVAGLGARAALALDAAQRWSEQGEMVAALVRVLLPEQPPAVPGVAFAARYLPASGDVAGDWWEAQLLADGTVLVGVGDAAGHGLPAVSQMSQLRQGARALAVVEDSPAALLAALDRQLTDADARLATAVYGRLDPATGGLRWSSAGHVPPLLASPDGKVRVLSGSGGPPLGAPARDRDGDEDLVLRRGETLVLYTDGVVERRREPLDEGISRLAATVGRHATSPLDELADRIVTEHRPFPADDRCLLLLRRA